MKIGDRVRFLNEVGGGIVKGFQNKDIVYIEDEDGFEIPMMKSECVVVETDNYNKPIAKTPKKEAEEIKLEKQAPKVAKVVGDTVKRTIDEPEISPFAAPEERGGNKLNVHLAFLPVNSREISTTPFEAYLINDSNYYLFYTYSLAEGNGWRIQSRGVLEPNTKVLVDEFKREGLNDRESLFVQFIAFKEKRTYQMKEAVSKQIKVDAVKFYKLHSLRNSPFFTEPSIIYDIVVDDTTVSDVKVDADKLKTSLLERKFENAKPKVSKRRREKNGIIEIDLHINELLDDTRGMDNAEMLTYQLDKFKEIMQEYASAKEKRIVFIHGKGEGVLRKALLDELKRSYPKCRYQDASFKEYGYGATMITIK